MLKMQDTLWFQLVHTKQYRVLMWVKWKFHSFQGGFSDCLKQQMKQSLDVAAFVEFKDILVLNDHFLHIKLH
jgi:hypothetical protein